MLASLQRFKQSLDIKNDNNFQDDLLEFILNQSTKIIEKFCNQNLISKEQTIYFEINKNLNSKLLNFVETPLEILSSYKKYKCDGVCSEWQSTDICELIQIHGSYKLLSNFSADYIYKFTIQQGYEIDAVPYDLQQICLKVATYLYKSQRGGAGGGTIGISSKSENSPQGLTTNSSYVSEDEFYKSVRVSLLNYTVVTA